ncbi:MAG TPA: sugar nucleotide-binding protein [Candidatus Peribacteria bacterium]|nr:sugar nucleotide-binding protein [Candidatus Peribacteria bacterium]
METIVILGGRGYIGTHLKAVYPQAHVPPVDVADAAAVGAMLDELKPDVVINAAGKTGRPNVDWCETHKDETIRSNVAGPLVLLDACSKRGIYWVHVGSGCIYEGDRGGKGFTEEDPPNFYGSFYARTKLWSDQMLKDFPVLQLRLRMPFDGSGHPRSLISKVCKYTKVLDERNSLTYIPDFIAATQALIAKRKTGIYNMVNPGAMSPYEMMERYQQIVDPSHAFEKISARGLSAVTATGRSNCILSTAKLQKEGIAFRPLEQAVDEAMRALKAMRA